MCLRIPSDVKTDGRRGAKGGETGSWLLLEFPVQGVAGRLAGLQAIAWQSSEPLAGGPRLLRTGRAASRPDPGVAADVNVQPGHSGGVDWPGRVRNSGEQAGAGCPEKASCQSGGASHTRHQASARLTQKVRPRHEDACEPSPTKDRAAHRPRASRR